MKINYQYPSTFLVSVKMANTPNNHSTKNTLLYIHVINPNIAFYLKVIRTKIMFNAREIRETFISPINYNSISGISLTLN